MIESRDSSPHFASAGKMVDHGPGIRMHKPPERVFHMDRHAVLERLKAEAPALRRRYGVASLAVFGSMARGDER